MLQLHLYAMSKWMQLLSVGVGMGMGLCVQA
jgi:hypothetical protein